MADLCGCATLVASLEACGVDHVFGIAGQPVTHAAELAAARLPSFEWSINEKVALECAFGLSTVGVRSAVVMKQCGLNVALDPFLNAVCHTTVKALFIVVGDDIGATSSTCEQDSRVLARAASAPVLEPRNGDDIAVVISVGAVLSEAASTPVVIRISNDLHTFAPSSTRIAATPTPTPTRPRSEVAFGLTKLGRQQFHRMVSWPLVQAAVDAATVVSVACEPPCESAVLAVGAAARHQSPPRSGRCWATTAASWPLPTAARSFVQRHQDVLVLEEPHPFLEGELRILAAAWRDPVKIRGRLTGHLPPEGRLLPAVVEAALDPMGVAAADWSTIDKKVPGLPDAPPPYDALFRAVARIRAAGAFVAADVGSAVKLCYPPYVGADVALCLGSAISVSAGAARTGRPSVAVIGDFALLHSGLEALIDSVRRVLPLTVLVLLNGLQAQTGGQPTAIPEGPILPDLVEAIGARLLGDFALDDLSDDFLRALLDGWLADPTPGVALIRPAAVLLPASGRHERRPEMVR